MRIPAPENSWHADEQSKTAAWKPSGSSKAAVLGHEQTSTALDRYTRFV
jgi:hypothetical protein